MANTYAKCFANTIKISISSLHSFSQISNVLELLYRWRIFRRMHSDRICLHTKQLVNLGGCLQFRESTAVCRFQHIHTYTPTVSGARYLNQWLPAASHNVADLINDSQSTLWANKVDGNHFLPETTTHGSSNILNLLLL